MKDSELVHRLDALEKRQRDLEKMVRDLKQKGVKKTPVKKKPGGKK